VSRRCRRIAVRGRRPRWQAGPAVRVVGRSAERGGERGQDVAAVAGQRGDGDDAVDGGQHVPGGLPGQGVLQRKQREQGEGQPAWETQGEQRRDPEQGLRGGQQELLDLPGVRHQRRGAAASQVGDRQAADQQGPLVDLAGDQGADGIGALAVHGEQNRNDELR
jgi:hypothetical protein